MSVHTFKSMGTVVSVRLGTSSEMSDSAVLSGALAIASLDVASSRESVAVAAAQQVFDELNEKFSLYLDTSEISQIARGEVLLSDSSERMREAYAEALLWREATNGAFTPHRPDGVLDLSGTVKAAAIAEAATAIESCGFESFSINAGGEILTHGSPGAGAPEDNAWVTGIVDPQNRSELLSVVALTPEFPAMATSGSAERGDHIWARPGATNDFLQATVIAGDIITADVCATAIIAGGQETLDHLTANFEIAVLVVKSNGELLANARFPKLVAR
ncbi:MAG: FAD:protein FMN transferase [Actinomycetales bacterium]|nr:FAD:protein FMN transferase [Actinomycetales bacterium]